LEDVAHRLPGLEVDVQEAMVSLYSQSPNDAVVW
jgi:hypothetical protein